MSPEDGGGTEPTAGKGMAPGSVEIESHVNKVAAGMLQCAEHAYCVHVFKCYEHDQSSLSSWMRG